MRGSLSCPGANATGRVASVTPTIERVRTWLAAHRAPTGAELAAGGLVVPHWPQPWGLDATPAEQLEIDALLINAGIARPFNPIGIGWAAPTILHAGTADQQQRWLPGALSGDVFWCQLFSEPEAGSDLASLRTIAVRDGDHYVVSGQKVWNTWSERAALGILLARTDREVPKHKGITYFVCPMDAPGITVRTIREMSGGHHFCEVFFDEVPIPVDHRLGGEGDGWRLATVTLANERVSLADGGVLWGMGPESHELLDHVHSDEPLDRQRIARVQTEAFVLARLRDRQIAAALAGSPPGPEVSVRKALADEHGQTLTSLAHHLSGSDGLLTTWTPPGADAEPAWGTWHWATMFSRALTIGGGTSEVQRNILGERVLGLPRG
jgi:3-oxochol-4-en-24-oyl-CoA dehydrogenase